MIPTLAMTVFSHDVEKVTAPETAAHFADPHVLILLLLSGLVGMGICYFGFECQREVSATSFFVMQNVSKVAVVCVGITVFGDPLSSPWAILGLILSLGGSFAYGKTQMELNKAVAMARESESLISEAQKKQSSSV